MGKTLYLTESRTTRVKRDGPSLWVVRDGEAGWRIPARAVGRVVVAGNVALEASVITLFADRGVPMTFLSEETGAWATVLGVRDNPDRPRRRQAALPLCEEASRRVQDWLDYHNRKVWREVLRDSTPASACKGFPWGNRKSTWETALPTICRAEPAQVHVVFCVVGGLFHAVLLERVLAAELDPHIGVLEPRKDFALVGDLLYALEGEVARQVIGFFRSEERGKGLALRQRSWRVTPDGLRASAHRFENRRDAVARQIDALIDRYLALLRGAWA
jgi:hypothetical protein